MQDQPTPAPIIVTRDGICVVDGYGIQIRVERGHLVIADGTGPDRRQSRFSRPLARIRRLVLLGHTGFVTLEAVRWLQDVGIGLVHLGPDGRLLATSGSLGLDEPALRRAQAAAWGTATGLGIARSLLRTKLFGQAQVARRLVDGDAVAARIEEQVPRLDGASDQHALMVIEAAAAADYWQAWSGLHLRWARQDARRVPEHWRRFTTRVSPLTASPRRAADPQNALLNLIQSLVEAEARLACLAIGLDPGLGVLHADQRARDSLALDIQEAVRPEADGFVLDLLTRSVLRASDFIERRDGSVRVLPPLTHRLSGTVGTWRRLVAPVTERVAHDFARAAKSRIRAIPTRLTESNRSAGRSQQRRNVRPATPRDAPRLRGCEECGEPVIAREGYCSGCAPLRRARNDAAFVERARRYQQELHNSGEHPSMSAAAQRSRGLTNAAHGRARYEWEQTHSGGANVSDFVADILPGLQFVSATRMAAATGLSLSYCSAIRKGMRLPHPRWWAQLAELGDSSTA
jgi:CRISPR-associated endonuclease Cas1